MKYIMIFALLLSIVITSQPGSQVESSEGSVQPPVSIVPVFQQESQPFNGIDVIFAVDNSGSMASSLNIADYKATDLGLTALQPEISLGSLNLPTDPNRVRFEMTRFLINWLAGYADLQSEQGAAFNTYVSVIAFDQNVASVMNWTPLGVGTAPLTEEDEASDTILFSDPNPTLLPANSSYINLYQEIDNLLAARPTGADQRLPVIIIVSDSLPCDPSYEFSEELGQGSYHRDCERDDLFIAPHLAVASRYQQNFPTNTQTALYFAIAPAIRPFYESFNWNAIADTVTYGTDDIYSLTAPILEFLLTKSAQVLGQDRANLPLTMSNTSNQFMVPPYQASLELLMMATSDPSDLPAYSFEVGGQTVTPDAELFQSSTGAFKRFHFDAPPPGTWQISTTTNNALIAYAVFEEPQSSLQIPPTATLYEPIKVTYEIEQVSNLAQTQSQYPLNLDVVVRSPGGGDSVPLTMRLNSEQTAWEAEFLPTIAGTYAIQSNITPIEEWAGVLTDAGFLQPTRQAQNLVVNDVVFELAIQVSVPEGADPVVVPPNDRVTITRAQSIVITVARSDDAPLPPQIEAAISVSPGGEAVNNACPSAVVETRRNVDGLFIASDPIVFGREGECQIGLTLSVNDDRLLQQDNTETVLQAPQLVRVTVKDTRELTFNILDEEGNILTGDETSMYDIKALPRRLDAFPFIEWENESKRLNVVVVDQTNEPVFPIFAPAVLAEYPEDPIPFTLAVLDESGTDVSEKYDIRIEKKDTPGYYGIDIEGLPPQNYEIRVVRQNYELSEIHQYADDAPEVVTASLMVKNQQTDDVAQWTGIGLAALLFGVTAVRTGRRVYRRIGRLQGNLVVYEESDDQIVKVWDYPLHETGTNDYQFPLTELPLWKPPIIGARAFTRRRSDGRVYLTIHVSTKTQGNEGSSKPILQNAELRPGEKMHLLTEQGRTYSVMIDDGTSNLDS